MNSVTNTSFNKCLDEIPSCKGLDDWSHRLFLTTNEGLQSKTLTTLAKQPLVGNTIIGVSGFSTLNFAAVRGTTCPTQTGELENIILIDRSARVEHFWNKMKEIIATSKDRFDAVSQLTLLLAAEKDRYYGDTPVGCSTSRVLIRQIENLREEIQRGESWLSSDEKFAKIKKIFDGGHFVFKRLDCCDIKAFESMKMSLKEQGATIDSIYLSNVYEYLKSNSDKKDFIASIEQVIAPKTLTIYTEPRSCYNCDALNQVIRRRNKDKAAKFFAMPLSGNCKHATMGVETTTSDISNVPQEVLSQLTPELFEMLKAGKIQITYKK